MKTEKEIKEAINNLEIEPQKTGWGASGENVSDYLEALKWVLGKEEKMRIKREIEAKLDDMVIEMAKVEDQACHISRFPKKAHSKIRHDLYWLEGAIEILEWILEDKNGKK